jgi:hypothetical protein
MAIAPPTPQLVDTLHEACRLAGLNPHGARLIHHYVNAVFHLPSEAAVARITAHGSPAYAATARAVCDWLVNEHDFPATRPLPNAPPVTVADAAITFWVYYPQAEPAPPVASGHLADLLKGLHNLPDPPHSLPAWRPLTSLETTVRAIDKPDVLTEADRVWLLEEISDIRARLADLDWPLGHGLIHGDAWAGNLLWESADEPSGTAARPLLGDWDGVARGPREIDLIPTWHAATRYGRGPTWAEAFTAHYGYDLSSWAGYPVLARMRDLVQLTGPLRRTRCGSVFERVLHQRLAGIRARDTSIWTAL